MAASGDAWRVQTQCLVTGAEPLVDLEVRFLHVVSRQVAHVSADGRLEFVEELTSGRERILAWDEAVERRFAFPCDVRVTAGEERESVDGGVIVRTWEEVQGDLDVGHELLLRRLGSHLDAGR